MKEVSCYLCNSAERQELLVQTGHDPYLDLVDPSLHKEHRAWHVCLSCGFVYRSPALTQDELAVMSEHYEADVFRNVSPDVYFDRIIGLPPSESENHMKSMWLRERLHSLDGFPRSDAAVLDVGCGGGTLLYTLGQVLGTQHLWGIELNPAYAELASRRSGAVITQAAFEAGIFGHSFDLVVLAKVLEHVPDPIPFLSALRHDVRKNGALFVEVPDIIDFQNLPSSDPRFFIPHIYYYSSRVLAAMLAQAGFEVLTSRTVTTHRGRSYLQVLARPSDDIQPPQPPYDEPTQILALRSERVDT